MLHCSLQRQETVLQHGPRWDGLLFNLHTQYREKNPQPITYILFLNFMNCKPILSSNVLPVSPGWTQQFALTLQPLPPGCWGADCPPSPSPQQALSKEGGSSLGLVLREPSKPQPQSPLPAGCEHTGAELCWGKDLHSTIVCFKIPAVSVVFFFFSTSNVLGTAEHSDSPFPGTENQVNPASSHSCSFI